MIKNIIGYEELYTIDSEGTVISKRTNTKLIGSIIKRDGYRRVTLTDKNGVQNQHKIHRLVATHFIPNPQELEAVDHINENKLDNRVENLRWCTRGDNARFYANHRNRYLEGKKVYGPKEPPKSTYNQGSVYGTVENLIKETGKKIKINGMLFQSCGSAAAWIVEQEASLGNIRNKDTISKELRKYLQGRRPEWKMYDKYQVGSFDSPHN